MTEKAKQIKISATRTPYRRAGLDLSEPLTMDADKLTSLQVQILSADPVVHFETVETPPDQADQADQAEQVEQVAPQGGEPMKPAANAKELIEQVKTVEDMASLDALLEGGENRKSVVDAIEAQRAKIQAQTFEGGE